FYNHRQFTDSPLPTCLNSQYSFIRIFNALIESEALDVYINNEFLLAKGLKALEIGSYVSGSGGKYSIQVYLTNTKDNPIVEVNDVEMIGGQLMTLAITGDSNNLKLVPIIDNVEQKSKPNNSVVRFYNLTPDPLIFLMTLNGYKLARQAESNNGSEYIDILIGNYLLGVRPADGIGQILKAEVKINVDKIYTLYCVGTSNPELKKLGLGYNFKIVQAIDGNTIIEKCSF
ncbi:DUF4397 domain-containing protein, partial [Romboutsia sp.]|uniref:DUF4397 domain-containing protein n=1 Tax=Romboutsia sp. TaxID=1965302 RepID=UPI002B987BC3